MGSFSRGLYLGVSVADSHGISFLSVKGMDLRERAMRFMRAKGEGVAEMRVRGSIAGVDIAARLQDGIGMKQYSLMSEIWASGASSYGMVVAGLMYSCRGDISVLRH